MKRFIIEKPWWVTVVLLLFANGIVFGGWLPDATALTWLASSIAVLIWRNNAKQELQRMRGQQISTPPAVRDLPGPVRQPTVWVQPPGQHMPDVQWRPFAADPSPRRVSRAGQSLAELVQSMQVMQPVEPLDDQIEVAGETHYIRNIKAVFREAGRAITSGGTTLREVPAVLVPEPWNEHDENAVAVMIGTRHVGYLPQGDALEYSRVLVPLAQQGLLAAARARVWAKDDGAVWARVTVMATPPEYFG